MKWLAVGLFVGCCGQVWGIPRQKAVAEGSDFREEKAAVADSASSTSTGVKPAGGSFFRKIWDYFSDSNQEHPDKRLDITFIGGPSYSAETSVQIGLMMAGQYRTRRDGRTPISNMAIYAQGAVTGLYNFGLEGYHVFPSDHWRINYGVNFKHYPLKFWGLGYEMESDKANESDYTLLQSKLYGDFLWHVPNDVYIGPALRFQYEKGIHCERPELWDGQRLKQIYFGLGFVFSRDTRDVPTNPLSGLNLRLQQMFYPRGLGNSYRPFSSSDVTVGWYHRFWPSGVWAMQFHGTFTYWGHPGWTMMPSIDGGKAMRGYFEGRYRGENQVDVVVELRQHVWRRNGIVVWGGVGSVFSKFRQITMRHLLPTYGLGYRWEFKKRVNIRVDLGFGRHSSAFCVGINEAF